jgi:membrane protease YdiL (CAAX protease family)
MENQLRPFWSKFMKFDWRFGLFLILLICIPRFILVLNANATGNYGSIGLIMTVSAIVPFIFLNKNGRKNIGISKPANFRWLIISLITGLVFSYILYWSGQRLFGDSYENWYHYIGKSYNIPSVISPRDKLILFSITAITSMIFSPVGEELFFRGIVHASFERTTGEKRASMADGTAFALTHLSHFGLVYINNHWSFFALPALIWVISMYLASILFYACKKYSGSILGAIICHAAFNLGMVFCIFYMI